MNPEDLMNPETLATMVEMGIAASTNVVLAAIILIIGLFIAGSVRKAIRTAVHKSETMDDTLGGFFGSLAYYGIMAMVVIAMMGTFGIPRPALSPHSVPPRWRSAWPCRARCPTWPQA